MDFALWELIETGEPQDEIAALIRLSPSIPLSPEVRIISAFDDIITCRVPRKNILETWSDESIASFKAPRLLQPELEISSEDLPELPALENVTEILPTDHRRPPHLAETGKGVVLGFVDWGFDFAHPDFLNEDSSTRLLALWDQRSKPGKMPPQPYGYGVVHTQEAINQALKTANPYKALNYYPAESDPMGDGSHATHVASIAGGNGQGGGPTGIAPDAELVFVHMTTLNAPGQEKLGDSVSLAEAVRFIFDIAGDAPCVVNLSMGRHGEPHDGTTLIEQAFDNILKEKPGRAIINSGGNYYNRKIHTSNRVLPGGTVSFDWLIPEGDPTPNQLEIWYSGRDILEIEVASPDEETVCRTLLGKQNDLVIDGKIVGRIYHRKLEPNNHDNHITIYLYPPAPQGAWRISLIAADVIDGRFNAWIERDYGSFKNQSVFRDDEAIADYTTGTICNGCRTFAVGAYNPHSPQLEMGSFSSAGPTRDGRIKPNLAAPGIHILAARSAPNNDVSGKAPLLTRKSGTSMAAPHVAGTVALMMEAAGRPLQIEEIHKILMGTAQEMDGQDPHRCGSGYLDIERAVEAAREIRLTPEVEPLPADHPRKVEPVGVERFPGHVSDRILLAVHSEGEELAMQSREAETSEFQAFETEEKSGSGQSATATKEPRERQIIKLEVGQEKKYLLKPDEFSFDSDAQWSYHIDGDEASLMVSLDDLQVPPSLNGEPGNYQLLTIIALAEGKAKVHLSLGTKNKSPDTQKTLWIKVEKGAEEAHWEDEWETGSETEDSTGTAWGDVSEDTPYWISREVSSLEDNELIEALTRRIEALEASNMLHLVEEAEETVLETTFPEWTESTETSELATASISLTDIADSLIEQGEGAGPSETLIRQSLSEAGVAGWLPTPAEAFDEFLYAGLPGLQEVLGDAYEVIGLPGVPLIKPIEAGDILIRRALGEGMLAHTALLDAAELSSSEQLMEAGLTAESTAPGWYVPVLEGGFLPHGREHGYARRILDWKGRVAEGQLLLRPLAEALPKTEYTRWIQASLNQILGLSLAVDGQLGPKTKQAIISFQKQKGLVADGIVGKKTEQALLAAGAPPLPGTAASTVGAAGKGNISPDWVARCQGTPTVLDQFDFDKANLTPAHQSIISGLAQKIAQSQSTAQPVTAVCIVGYTDNAGSGDYNLELGQKRSEVAQKALIDAIEKLKPGLSAKLDIKPFSMGELAPVGDEKTAQGRAMNRRVAIFITQAAKPIPKPKKDACFTPATSSEDPTKLVLAFAGHKDFDAGSANILGESFKVTGRVFYPAESAGKGKPFNKKIAASGKVPIIFMAHGNHSVFRDPKNKLKESCSGGSGRVPIPNHLGYVYLQEMFAKMGIITVSVNCNQTNCRGGSPTNIRQRAGLMLEAMKHFHTLNKSSDPIFGKRIQFAKTGLFGHSRGAEAVLVVPELIGARPAGLEDVVIQSVISLAPTDYGASTGVPNGYTFMTILPAGDGDVVSNDGAKFFDQGVPTPYKCQLYIHHTNHNFFNREWPEDEGHGPPRLTRPQHERLLSVYSAAFYRDTLLGQPFKAFLRNDQLPPATSTKNVHISFEEKGFVTVDDHENRNIALNSLSQPTAQSNGMTAAEFDFSQKGSAQFNSTFFGKSTGMVAQSSSPNGDYVSQLGTPTNLTGKEIWIRAAEVYDGSSVPPKATGFVMGLEDSSGNIALVSSDSFAGGLPRPYDRSADDIAIFKADFTKTMLKTFRFPASCFEKAAPGFNITQVTAIHIQLDRNDKRAIAFDQLQIV